MTPEGDQMTPEGDQMTPEGDQTRWHPKVTTVGW
jgi:hypothetical protein